MKVLIFFSIYVYACTYSIMVMGAPIAQLGERQTLDRKVAGSILTGVAVLEQDT